MSPWTDDAGQIHEEVNASIAASDQPVLVEMRETALRHQFRLRVMPPGCMITMDIDPARLNVHVRKAEDGIYRIADDMHFDGQKRLLEAADKTVMRGTDRKIGILRPLKFRLPGT